VWRFEREHVCLLGAATLVGLTLFAGPAAAQMGSIQHFGYLEYQYRQTQGDDIPSFSTQLGTWRAHASTWFWRPYILQLDGDLGLTRTTDASADVTQKGSVITGGLFAQAFARSRFPLRVHFEQRDSRVDGGAVDRDLTRRTWGFNQQLSTVSLGRYGLDYRSVDVDELFVDGVRDKRKTASDQLQLTTAHSLGRNQFDFLGIQRDLSRETLMRAEDRLTLSLRHRFRGSPRFYIEDTTFFSDEQLEFDHSSRTRQLLQFNGRSQWQAQTKRPLRVTGRMVLRSVETGSGDFEATTSSASLSGTALYQATNQLTLSGNVAVVSAMPEEGSESSSVLQRLRAAYRGDIVDLGSFRYDWGASTEVGNRRQRSHGKDTVQDANVAFYHGISRATMFGAGRQFNISANQSVSARGDSLDLREQSLSHSLSASLNRQMGRNAAYLRLSATDRRTTGFRENTFQLVTLQASSRMQVSRKRSWNGGIGLQYSSNTNELEDGLSTSGSSVSYSANLSYNERDLFNVPNLEFMSELRFLSSEFRNDDIFDQATETLDERDSNFWRNRLRYRVGQLELQLNADVREVNGTGRSQVLLLIRRYYGAV
jgi:hypothetical protein